MNFLRRNSVKIRGVEFLIVIAVFVCLIPFGAWAAETKADDPGKKAFIDSKCNVCHAVSTEGIESKMKATSTKAPDLSGVGAEQTADFITKFLKKEVTLHDKKHSKAWTGKEEDLQAIVTWLSSLKTPAAQK
jgi:hypothetical protein